MPSKTLVVLSAVAILGLGSMAMAKGVVVAAVVAKAVGHTVECMVMVTSTMVNSVIVS